MAYESVDHLQRLMTEEFFGYAKDSKKAAGRALGTIVEILTFYLLKSWGLMASIAIERRIPEFGNATITHNVEYSLHPVFEEYRLRIPRDNKSITVHHLLKSLTAAEIDISAFDRINNTLLSRDVILRNACTIARGPDSYLVASIIGMEEHHILVSVAKQGLSPYGIFECKRVGVEEGTKKGPQTIEKAKQGAYVARTVSSLQKVRLESGEIFGIIYDGVEILRSGPYRLLLEEVIRSTDSRLLRDFVLTVGVVSNHGNWFTSDNHNKELRVLAQSYDWLLFLTDEGLTEFIEETIRNPNEDYQNIRQAFLDSYGPHRTKNQFTKVQMNFSADRQLLLYFKRNAKRIASWFNVIAPEGGSLKQLQQEISLLRDKPWERIK